NLHASTSYTYTKSEQKSGEFKGQPLNKMPKHMLNIGLDYEVSDTWNTWMDYNYRGKTSDYLSRTAMDNGTPGYGTFDAGAVFKILLIKKLPMVTMILYLMDVVTLLV